jgi:integrase
MAIQPFSGYRRWYPPDCLGVFALLTDLKIRAAKPAGSPYKLTDQGGLYLLCTPQGSRLWRLKYRLGGREKLLSLGPYPEVRLGEARSLQAEAKRTLRQGQDPSTERKRLRAGLTPSESFEALARERHARQAPRWTPHHAAEVLASLERYVFPKLGALHVNAITAPMVLAVLREIEARPAIEMAHRVRVRMSAVFVYALSCGIGQGDPAAIVKGALSPMVRGRQPAIIELHQLREMLRKAEAEPAHPATKAALRFLALTVVRPGELRGAAWAEIEGFDGEALLWRIPAARMKMREEHAVPLSAEAVAVIQAMKPLSGRAPFIFPNTRHAHRPLAENSLNYLLYRAGYHGKHCPHGFRAAFSSIMNERHPAEYDAIEAALAHKVGGVRGAYLRAPFLERRRTLMAEWAGLLMEGAVDAQSLLLGPRR